MMSVAVALILPFLQGAAESDYEPVVEPASAEGELAIAAFEFPDSFEVELFAAEPMLANPVCLYVDHSGDLYVAETFRHFAGVTDMREHLDWLDDDAANRTVDDRVAMLRKYEGAAFDAYARATDRVKWIRDTDGDGRADVDVVFAEGFTKHEAGIGAGLLSYRGDVYYTCIPDLWRLRDEDGNRRAEVKEVLSTGYGVNIALLGHDLHGLRIGPDGKLYFSCGDRGFHVETPDGPIEHAHTGAVLRCDLDGANLEVFASGLRNPQELAFDEYGNLFTGDNNSDGGDEARWVHVIEGMDAGWRYGYQFITEPNLRGPWNDEQLWRPAHEGQAAYIVPPIANLADGPSGLTYNPGTGMPAKYDRHFFLCDFRGDPNFSGIHAFTVTPKGASFELGPVERLIWNTLVTDCDFGPDGSLYFTDWVQSWNKTGKGRVYRMFAPDALAVETATLLKEGMGERGVDELVELLGHRDQRVRQEAQFELVRRGAGETLRDVASDVRPIASPGSRPDLAQLHAIWGMGMLGDSPGLLTTYPDARVREEVARVLRRPAYIDPGRVEQLLELLTDSAPRVRLQAAITLGKYHSAAAIGPLFDMLRADGEDPVLRHGAVMGLAGCATPEQIAIGAADEPRHVKLGAVVALRRLKSPAVRVFLEDADPLVALEAARAVYDLPIEGELDNLRPREGMSYAYGRRALNAIFRSSYGAMEFAGVDTLARLSVDEVLDERLRLEAVELLRKWREPPGRDGVTGEWRPLEPREGVARFGTLQLFLEGTAGERLGTGPEDVRRAWIALIEELSLTASAGRLQAWALEPLQPAGVRVDAMLALRELAPARVGEVVEATLHDRDPSVRAAALELLGGIAPEKALPLLVDAARLGERAERRTAFRLLAELGTDAGDAALAEGLESLARDELPGELTLDLIVAAEQRDTPRLTGLLEAHRAGRADELLAPFLDGLLGGDPELGRELYLERADLQCLRCHKDPESGAEVGGDQVGPDLRGLGMHSTRLQILTSVIDPNRRIKGGYQGTLFFLDDGTRVEGQVLSDESGLIRVLDADGLVHEIDPRSVETRRAGLSAMPAGVGELITRQEMRDLLEYLCRI